MSSPNTPTTSPAWDQIAPTLASIADSLAVIAAYVEDLRLERSGERTYEVGSWVLSQTGEGDPCVYLYSTHPKLDYRVTTVYVERFAELPFDVARAAKTYDGEQAPTRQGAAQRGYLNTCPTFTVATKPTGGQTSTGAPVHRFTRVLSAAPSHPAPPQPPQPPAPPAPPQPPAGHLVTQPARNGPPQRLPRDAALLAQLDARERYYAAQGHTGKASNATYGIWLSLLAEHYNPGEVIAITSRLTRDQPTDVQHAGYLPKKARLTAILEWLLEADADGHALRPYALRQDRLLDLPAVLSEALQPA